MAKEDLTLRMRAQGARRAARDVDTATGSVRKLDSSTKDVNQSSKKARGSIRLFSSGLRPMASFATGAAGALGVLGLAGTLRTAVGEFQEARKIGRQTSAVLKSIGADSWTTAGQIGDLANAISLQTGIDDEAIQKGENLLLTFKNVRNEVGQGNDIFNRATQAAIDLSAAGFGSIESSSKQMGKALQDPVKGMTALSRSGVTFTADQKKTIQSLVETGETLEAQKIILKEVESQVKGSAAAQADPIDKLRVAWGNLMELLGQQLWPVVTRGTELFASFVQGVQDGTGAGKDFRDGMVQAFHTLEDVYGVIKPIAKFFWDHPQMIAIAVEAWATYKVASLAAMGVFKARMFRDAFMRSVPAAATSGTAAGRAYSRSYSVAASTGIGRASGKGGVMARAFSKAGARMAGPLMVGLDMALSKRNLYQSLVNVGTLGMVNLPNDPVAAQKQRDKAANSANQVLPKKPTMSSDEDFIFGKKGGRTGARVTGYGSWVTGEAGPELNTYGASGVTTRPIRPAEGNFQAGLRPAGSGGGGNDIFNVPVTLVMPGGEVLARTTTRANRRKKATS